MARPLRVEYPGAYYHVINRGNGGENIFKNDRDKEKFLEYLAISVERFSVVVTVLLVEATDAAKKSDTTLDKSSTTSIPNPVLAGKLRDFGDDNTLGFELESDTAFDGESASNQSNSLEGSITVTVAKVYPGGNLYVQGEKWIQINQGNEYIRLRGIIRPVDISSDNSILSTKIADARMSYSGTGATADVNKAGWLSRFFISPIWPF